jgi:hypothetical protein
MKNFMNEIINTIYTITGTIWPMAPKKLEPVKLLSPNQLTPNRQKDEARSGRPF